MHYRMHNGIKLSELYCYYALLIANSILYYVMRVWTFEMIVLHFFTVNTAFQLKSTIETSTNIHARFLTYCSKLLFVYKWAFICVYVHIWAFVYRFIMFGAPVPVIFSVLFVWIPYICRNCLLYTKYILELRSKRDILFSSLWSYFKRYHCLWCTSYFMARDMNPDGWTAYVSMLCRLTCNCTEV